LSEFVNTMFPVAAPRPISLLNTIQSAVSSVSFEVIRTFPRAM